MPCRYYPGRILASGVILLIFLSLPHGRAVGAEGMKIGVVDFQKVLNLSESGKRSRKILMASKEQKASELKAIGENLKKEAEDLKNNILLTEAAKKKKEQGLREKERKWRENFKAAERELQTKQFKASESIFSEVQTVIHLIAKEDDFDFILERQTARSILYSRAKFHDITDKLIERYNSLSK